MTKKPKSQKSKDLEKLIMAGEILSNIAYNLGQESSNTGLDDLNKKLLWDACKKWDDLKRIYHKTT